MAEHVELNNEIKQEQPAVGEEVAMSELDTETSFGSNRSRSKSTKLDSKDPHLILRRRMSLPANFPNKPLTIKETKQLAKTLRVISDDFEAISTESTCNREYLKQDCAEIELLQTEIRELKKGYEDLTKEKDDLKRENETLTKENEDFSKENRDLCIKLAEVEEKLLSTENSWKFSYNGVFLTKKELGRGGWGTVLEGKFRGQAVAVKEMYAVIKNEHNLKLFHREINIMSQLRHPNLLQFIGAVFDHPSGNPLIITEVMDTSLRKAYEEKQLTPDQQPVILSIMCNVAVGLNYLHCLPDPIIHRDVSSANVLLESKGPGKWKTKISDFGSAKIARLAKTAAPGAFVYSAPESFTLLSRKELQNPSMMQSPQMDVYSFGVLLGEALMCTFPIDQDTFYTMLIDINSLTIKGPALNRLITSCIELNPQNRPNMDMLIKELDTL